MWSTKPFCLSIGCLSPVALCARNLAESPFCRVVRTAGVEPARGLPLRILSPVCLPVPPRPRELPGGGRRPCQKSWAEGTPSSSAACRKAGGRDDPRAHPIHNVGDVTAQPGATHPPAGLLALAKRPHHLVAKWLEEVGERGAGPRLDEGLDRHARNDLKTLEPRQALPPRRQPTA